MKIRKSYKVYDAWLDRSRLRDEIVVATARYGDAKRNDKVNEIFRKSHEVYKGWMGRSRSRDERGIVSEESAMKNQPHTSSSRLKNGGFRKSGINSCVLRQSHYDVQVLGIR